MPTPVAEGREVTKPAGLSPGLALDGGYTTEYASASALASPSGDFPGLIVILLASGTCIAILVIVVFTILLRKRKRQQALELQFLATEESVPLTDPQKPATCRFLAKLRRTLVAHPDIIPWSDDGRGFHVQNVRAFEARVLTDETLNIRAKSYKNWSRTLVNFEFKTVSVCAFPFISN